MQNIDVFGGEEIIAEHMTFKETKPYNSHFARFGFDTMNFLAHSGSYFFFVAGEIGYYLLRLIINFIVKHCPQNEKARKIGIAVYTKSFIRKCL